MEPDEDLYRRQLHIFEAEWKPADRCGTPGCTLADFHDGLCSTEQVLGRRKRPAPAAPARASGSVRGGGPKKHASIVLDDDGVSQEDDAIHDDDDDSLSLQHSAADPDPEGFLEGEEERLYAQLAAVQARKVARAAGQGGGKSAPGIEAMGSYAAAAPHLRPAPSPAPAPTPAPTAPTATAATAATAATTATAAVAPPLAQRQNSLPGPRPWSAWASLELRSLLGEWHLAEQAADIVEHSGAKSVLELETCADLKREVCSLCALCPLCPLCALCALCALRTSATPCALRWRRAPASSRCRRAGSTSCSPS